MSASAGWEPERQRRALRLMGIELPVFRARRPASPAAEAGPASALATRAKSAPLPMAASARESVRPRLRILGLSQIVRDDALFGGIVRSLGVPARAAVFGAPADEAEGAALAALAFGPGHEGVPTVPGLQVLRTDPRAKRTAWQSTLRPLAALMRRS